MQTLFARKTVSMTELREPAKVFSQAGNQPVAIMNRNQVVGYFVPATVVEGMQFKAAPEEAVQAGISSWNPSVHHVLKYLEDK